MDEITPCLLDKVNNSVVGDSFGFDNDGASPKEQEPERKEKRTWIRGGFAPKNKAKFDFLNMGGVRKAPAAPVKKQPVTDRSDSEKEDNRSVGFGKDFTAEFGNGGDAVRSGGGEGYVKPASSKFCVGDRVNNERFGNGKITCIEDKGRDNLLTVEFDDSGTKKMFEGFIELVKI